MVRYHADNHAHYDSLQGLYGWARDTLTLHSADPRARLYTLAQLEAGDTHDDLWNAAQLQMVRVGKMHVRTVMISSISSLAPTICLL